jgi:hypothetical protein
MCTLSASTAAANMQILGMMITAVANTASFGLPLFSCQNILQNISDFRHIESLDTCMKH